MTYNLIQQEYLFTNCYPVLFDQIMVFATLRDAATGAIISLYFHLFVNKISLPMKQSSGQAIKLISIHILHIVKNKTSITMKQSSVQAIKSNSYAFTRVENKTSISMEQSVCKVEK